MDQLSELTLSDENKVCFDVDSNKFYHLGTFEGDEETGEEAFYFGERKDFYFSIIGTKNGKSYTTDYLVPKTDARIMDNVPSEVPVSFTVDFYTGSLLLSDVAVDQTGSFLTVEGHPRDIGLNLAEQVPVTIKYTGKNLIYNEEYTCYVLLEKYLTVPIAHLKNVEYTMIISIQDSFGNTGSTSFDFKVERSDISSDCRIESADEGRFDINYKNHQQ